MHASRRKGVVTPQSLILGARDRGGPLSGPFWAELRTFIAVAKLRSFNKAGEALALSRQTVRRDIERLEDVLGHSLVQSSGAGTQVTATGHKLFELAVAFDRDVSAIEHAVRSSAQQVEGTVKLAVTDGFGLIYIAPALEEFGDLHPGIQLHLRRPGGAVQLSDAAEDIMIGFREDRQPGVTSRQLGQIHYVPYAGRRYHERRERRGETERPHAFLDSERYREKRGPFTSWQDLVATGQTVHLCDTSVTYAVMVKAGIGVGLLPTYNDLEPSLTRFGTGVVVEVPVYASALTERLKLDHVRVAYDYIVDLFPRAGFSNWGRGDVPVREARFARGYALLFNLPD